MRSILIALGVGVVAALVTMLRRRRGAIVIGAQLADAEARDRLHRQQFGDLPSPLPPNRYDPAKGEMSLIDPRLSDLDSELASICARYAASSDVERRALRNAATGDDFYTLLNFAKRAAVFALREHEQTWIQNGLTAVAMIDVSRIDERDLPLTLSLVHHAAQRLQLPLVPMFDGAAALAEPRTAGILRRFVRQSASYKDIEESWGYQEVPGSGDGFVQRGFDAYDPTLDLFKVALLVREAISQDLYEGDVTLATELPPIWFPSAARPQAEGILARSVATASVDGTLRPGEHEDGTQMFVVWIVETASEQDAATLNTLAHGSGSEGTATLVVHSGPLFALTVGRSVMEGVASCETAESIKRFEAPFRTALASQ
jgi:hypothetical protein